MTRTKLTTDRLEIERMIHRGYYTTSSIDFDYNDLITYRDILKFQYNLTIHFDDYEVDIDEIPTLIKELPFEQCELCVIEIVTPIGTKCDEVRTAYHRTWYHLENFCKSISEDIDLRIWGHCSETEELKHKEMEISIMIAIPKSGDEDEEEEKRIKAAREEFHKNRTDKTYTMHYTTI